MIFVLLPHPQTLGLVQRLGCHSLGEGSGWHLVGGDQRRCSTSCTTQDSPPTKNYPAPNVTVERLGNFGIDLYLRCNSRSFLCTDLDIFHSACLGKGTWTIMPHVPPGNTLGKLPFVASVLTDKQHLQKTPQFPHFELLGRWTWRPDGAHRPDTKKSR